MIGKNRPNTHDRRRFLAVAAGILTTTQFVADQSAGAGLVLVYN
jgi:hypothetical protein